MLKLHRSTTTHTTPTHQIGKKPKFANLFQAALRGNRHSNTGLEEIQNDTIPKRRKWQYPSKLYMYLTFDPELPLLHFSLFLFEEATQISIMGFIE